MGEVVKPFGSYKTHGAVLEIIEQLRDLLEQAERGEVVGFVWASVHPNDTITYSHIAGSGNALVLLAAADRAHHDIHIALDNLS